jgi:hypothetical protein
MYFSGGGFYFPTRPTVKCIGGFAPYDPLRLPNRNREAVSVGKVARREALKKSLAVTEKGAFIHKIAYAGSGSADLSPGLTEMYDTIGGTDSCPPGPGFLSKG